MKFTFRKNHHPLKEIVFTDAPDEVTDEIKAEVENEIQTQAFFHKVLRKLKYKRRKIEGKQ